MEEGQRGVVDDLTVDLLINTNIVIKPNVDRVRPRFIIGTMAYYFSIAKDFRW